MPGETLILFTDTLLFAVPVVIKRLGEILQVLELFENKASILSRKINSIPFSLRPCPPSQMLIVILLFLS